MRSFTNLSLLTSSLVVMVVDHFHVHFSNVVSILFLNIFQIFLNLGEINILSSHAFVNLGNVVTGRLKVGRGVIRGSDEHLQEEPKSCVSKLIHSFTVAKL